MKLAVKVSGVIHAVATIFPSILFIPLGTKIPLCIEKFCSWGEEISIWLRTPQLRTTFGLLH
jgi:hypothetical protein